MRTPDDFPFQATPEERTDMARVTAEIEQAFAAVPNRPGVYVHMTNYPRLQARHWSEIERECQNARWWVTRPSPEILWIRHPPAPTQASADHDAVLFERDTPATNMKRLVVLVQATPITAIVDNYFDDRAADRLVALKKMGVHFSQKLRILTSKDSARNITMYFNEVMHEIGAQQAELRAEPGDVVHAGRYLLLKGKAHITLGPSLNGFNVDDKAHRAPDKGELKGFEERWAASRVVSIGPPAAL